MQITDQIWKEAQDFLFKSNGSNLGDITTIYLSSENIVVGLDYIDTYPIKDGEGIGAQEWHIGQHTKRYLQTGTNIENYFDDINQI